MNPAIVWAILLVAFIVAEIATTGLVSIWFALGTLGALISAAIAPTAELVWLQVIIFLAVSGISLYFTRPLARKYHKVNQTATNAARVLDMIGTVRETVSDSAGAVYVDGKIWSARTTPGATISVDERVEILRIEGVKLIVKVQKIAPETAEVAEVEAVKKNQNNEEALS